MWKIILIAAAIGLAFIGVLLFAGHGDTSKTAKPQTYQPPAWASLLGMITSPFAPDVTLAQREYTARNGAYPTQTVPASSTDLRVARFALESPGAVLVSYGCHGGPSEGCSQSACLVSSPAPQHLPACTALSGGAPEHWRPCVSLLVHAGGGVVSFQSVTGTPTVKQITGAAAATAPGCAAH